MSRPQAPGPRAARGAVLAHVARELILWVAAGVGVLCLLVAAAAVLLHITPLVFRSGSMTPAIPTGSVALARTVPLDELTSLHKGEIVSLVRADGVRVTHRIWAVSFQDGQADITLKGDANRTPDPPVLTTDVERVVWSTPDVGYLLEDLVRAPVVFGGGAAVGMLVMWAFRRPATVSSRELALVTHTSADDAAAREGRITTDPPPAVATGTGPRHAAARRGRGRAAAHWGALTAAGVVLALGADLVAGSTPARAAGWGDTVRATGSFATTSAVAPATVTCANNGDNTVTIGWTYSGPTPAAFDVITNGTVIATAAGTSSSVRFTGSGLLNLGSNYTLSVRTDLTTAWTATSSASTTIKTVSVLGIAGAACA